MSIIRTAIDTFTMGRNLLRLIWLSAVFKKVAIADTRHLALFAWALPPNTNAGVHRPLSFIRYGSLMGWQIDAFHGDVPLNQGQHGEELLARVPADVKLHAVPDSSLSPSYSLTPLIDGGFNNAINTAIYAIEKLSKNPPNAVLASGPPFYVFIAAYFVAKHFSVPLVLDYRDEWTECPFDFVSAGPQDKVWEKRCIATAAAIFFTTKSHLEHQLQVFPELSREKTYLIPNGWEPDDFFSNLAHVQNNVASGTKKIEIAHIGNLAGHTPPTDFLDALQKLFTSDATWCDRIQVSFIGRRSPYAESIIRSFPYPHNLNIIDHLPKQEANRRMQQADILLLIATPELARYLPGKLFDYIAARRPVLVFGAPGESSKMVENLGVGKLCSSGSSKKLGSVISDLLVYDIKNRGEDIQDWLEHYRRDKLAHMAFDIISVLTSSPSSMKPINKATPAN